MSIVFNILIIIVVKKMTELYRAMRMKIYILHIQFIDFSII